MRPATRLKKGRCVLCGTLTLYGIIHFDSWLCRRCAPPETKRSDLVHLEIREFEPKAAATRTILAIGHRVRLPGVWSHVVDQRHDARREAWACASSASPGAVHGAACSLRDADMGRDRGREAEADEPDVGREPMPPPAPWPVSARACEMDWRRSRLSVTG